MGEPLIFISYTSADLGTARDVAAGLTRRGVKYFFDREHGGPGDLIPEMIDDALSGASHLLLIASPAALAANWVKEERNAALALAVRRGLVVIPGLLGLGPGDLRPLLGSRVAVDLSDLETALDAVAAKMRGEPAPAQPGSLFGDVPRLPDHHQERPDLMQPFKQLLLSGTKGVGVTGLHGMGGVGKTVLASALARDPEIGQAFAGGILWISLGETPDMAERLSRLAASAGIASVANQQDAAEKLKTRLAGRRVLLVGDDVWRQGDLDTLRDILPAEGSLLVTTRDSRLLRGFDAPKAVDALTPQQARGLLSSLLERRGQPLPPSGERLITRVGRHPLALAISARLVDPDDDLEPQLAELCLAFDRLDRETLSQEVPDYDRGRSVFDSLEISLARLEAADRERFIDLAVFPEEARVPVPVLGRLWSDATPRLKANLLASRSLARLSDGHLSLHDLQRDFARYKAGETLVERHRRLTGAYADACGSDWRRLADDGYVFQHLPWHLAQGGEADALKRLLLDYRWIEAKLAALGPAEFPADYRLKTDDAAVRRVGQTLDLSAHVLTQKTPKERRLVLPSQLLGRLAAEDGEDIATLLTSARATLPDMVLLPRRPTLEPPGGPLIRRLVGHGGVVGAVAFCPDGRRAVSGGWDRTLVLWDLDSGTIIRRLAGHTGWVKVVAVTADGRRAVSGSKDNTLALWDLEAGTMIRRLEGHTDEVNAVAVTADGRRAVSGAEDGSLCLWDLDSGALIRRLEGHKTVVRAVTVTADGRRAVSGSRDTTLGLWDLDSGALIRRLEGHAGSVRAVAVTADGRRAVSGSDDTTLGLWDLDTGALIHRLEGHTDWVRAVAVTADGRRAVSGSDDKTPGLWDLDSGALIRRLEGHVAEVNAVAVTADGHRAVSGSADGTLGLWDPTSGALIRRLEGHTNWINAVAVTADGRRAVSGSNDRTLGLWDLDSGALIRRLEGHAEWVRAVAVTADGRRAVSGSHDTTLGLWDLESGALIRRLEGHAYPIGAVAVTADDRRAVSGSWDNTLGLWDLASGALIRRMEGHLDFVTAVAVTADGRRAVSGSSDKTLGLWDLDSGTIIRRLEGHASGVTAVAVTADGRRVLSGSWDKTLLLWDLDSGTIIRRLEGHASGGTAVALLAGDRLAVSASADRTLRLWDLDTGACRAIAGCDHALQAVTAAGSVVVAGDEGGRVHVFDLIER